MRIFFLVWCHATSVFRGLLVGAVLITPISSSFAQVPPTRDQQLLTIARGLRAAMVEHSERNRNHDTAARLQEFDLGDAETAAQDAAQLLDLNEYIRDAASRFEFGVRDLYSALMTKLLDHLKARRADLEEKFKDVPEPTRTLKIDALLEDEVLDIGGSENKETKKTWTVEIEGVGRADFTLFRPDRIPGMKPQRERLAVRFVHEDLPLMGVAVADEVADSRHVRMWTARGHWQAGRIKSETGDIVGRHILVVGLEEVGPTDPMYHRVRSLALNPKPDSLWGKFVTYFRRLNFAPGWNVFRYVIEKAIPTQGAILVGVMLLKGGFDGIRWQLLTVSAAITIPVVTWSSIRTTIIDDGPEWWQLTKRYAFSATCAFLYRFAMYGTSQDWMELVLKLGTVEILDTFIKSAWDWKRRLRSVEGANRKPFEVSSPFGNYEVPLSLVEKQNAFFVPFGLEKLATLGFLSLPIFPGVIGHVLDTGVLIYAMSWPLALYLTLRWAENSGDSRINEIRAKFEESIPVKSYRKMVELLSVVTDPLKSATRSLSFVATAYASPCQRALTPDDVNPPFRRVTIPAGSTEFLPPERR